MQNYSIWKKVKENSLCFKKISDRFFRILSFSVANWSFLVSGLVVCLRVIRAYMACFWRF